MYMDDFSGRDILTPSMYALLCFIFPRSYKCFMVYHKTFIVNNLKCLEICILIRSDTQGNTIKLIYKCVLNVIYKY